MWENYLYCSIDLGEYEECIGAMQRILDTSARLKNYAEANGITDAEALLPEAKRMLEATESLMLQEMQRNVFIAGGPSDE